MSTGNGVKDSQIRERFSEGANCQLTYSVRVGFLIVIVVARVHAVGGILSVRFTRFVSARVSAAHLSFTLYGQF